jgi:hypothetical protein
MEQGDSGKDATSTPTARQRRVDGREQDARAEGKGASVTRLIRRWQRNTSARGRDMALEIIRQDMKLLSEDKDVAEYRGAIEALGVAAALLEGLKP